MKIAQIAPTWTSIPPEKYGGAEKIISLLTEELVARGHEVTLFASGDSRTKAKLVSVCEKAPGLTKETQMSIVNNMNHIFNMVLALEKSAAFDVIHWHLSKDIVPIMLAPKTKCPSIVTIHNHFYVHEEMPFLKPIFEHYKNFKNFISISNSHRNFFPFDYLATVYNGIDLDEFEYNEEPKDYMVWVGRFEFQKGAHTAIEVALKTKRKLILAAPEDNNEYFVEKIEPYLKNGFIEYVGEVNSLKRNELLRNARLFINPITWDEPFGLVVPESNACGTPVIAVKKGAMPELIREKENGFLVEPKDIEALIEAVNRVYGMKPEEYSTLRRNCRSNVENKFTFQRMTEDYENVYKKVARKHFLW